MTKTSIESDVKYVDMIAMRKRLFVFKHFIPIDITEYILKVEPQVVGEKFNTAGAVINGITGEVILGSWGAILGVLATSPKTLTKYTIYLSHDFEVNRMTVLTTSKSLDHYLRRRVNQ